MRPAERLLLSMSPDKSYSRFSIVRVWTTKQGRQMLRAADVAAFVLEKAGPMDAMKLQKLVYYGQAWSLALRQAPLFDDEIQAWAFGPVAPSLYRLHRGQYVVSRLPIGDPTAVAPEQARLLHGVIGAYAHLTGTRLSELTHGEAPWQEARQELPAGVPSEHVIGQESMRRFYAAQRPPFPW